MIAPRRRSLATADGSVSLLEWDGPPGAPLLLFLHANGFNALTYRAVLAPLAAEFRIIAPDLRGHGLTTLPTDLRLGRWTTYRDDLLTLVARLGARPLILAGHSMGATVGLMAAGVEPDIAAALVLAEPVLQPDSRAAYAAFARAVRLEERLLPRVGPARRRRTRFFSREDALKAYRGRGAFRSWPDESVADYVEGGLVESDGGFRLACTPQWEGQLYSIFPFGLARLGARVRVPVTILSASMQSSADPSVVEGFVHRNRNTRRLTVPDTTHFLPLEKPDLFRAELLRARDDALRVPAPRSSHPVE